MSGKADYSEEGEFLLHLGTDDSSQEFCGVFLWCEELAAHSAIGNYLLPNT